MLSSTYGEAALSEGTCCKRFQRFKNGDFDVEGLHGGGKEKFFEDSKFEVLLAEDSCQTQAISKRLKAMGIIQKQRNWVQNEFNSRDVKRRSYTCEQLLQRRNRQKFLYRFVIGDEKWIHHDNPKRRKSWGMSGHASTSTTRPNIHATKVMLCIWWDQLCVVYYELSKTNETVTADRYRTQLLRLSRALKEKRPQYQERHDKVILQLENVRPHVVKPVMTYLEMSKREILPHLPYSPGVASSTHHLFRSIAHGLACQHFRSYKEVK